MGEAPDEVVAEALGRKGLEVEAAAAQLDGDLLELGHEVEHDPARDGGRQLRAEQPRAGREPVRDRPVDGARRQVVERAAKGRGLVAPEHELGGEGDPDGRARAVDVAHRQRLAGSPPAPPTASASPGD